MYYHYFQVFGIIIIIIIINFQLAILCFVKLIVDFGIVDLLYYGFELLMLNFWRLLFVKCWNGEFFFSWISFLFQHENMIFFFLKYHTNKTFENIFQGIFKYVIKSLEKKNLFPRKYFFSKKFYFEINFNLNNKL